jgi:flavorubredoxin
MPPQSSPINQTILSTILASINGKQAVGLFESGGGEDEPIFPLRNKLQEIGAIRSFSSSFS